MAHREYLKLPGLVDSHVHLRVPGGEHKEMIRTGTSAALAGGFTTVLAMPNTHPPIVTLDRLADIRRKTDSEALCDVHYFAGASDQCFPELGPMARHAVGLKVYMNQTYGPLRVSGLAALLQCYRRWSGRGPIAVHAEGETMAVAVGLAAAFGRATHMCHVSRKSQIELIRRAKERGVPVTCEVTPHHLYLTEGDLLRLGALGTVKPPLATPADVDALWGALGTVVDCIATDHAPHTAAEKLGEAAPPGLPGLETALPLMLSAVAEGRLTMERLVFLMADSPRTIFHLPAQPDTWTEVDASATYRIGDLPLHTKCGWSPFKGTRVQGMVRCVRLRGRVVFRDGRITPIPQEPCDVSCVS